MLKTHTSAIPNLVRSAVKANNAKIAAAQLRMQMAAQKSSV